MVQYVDASAMGAVNLEGKRALVRRPIRETGMNGGCDKRVMHLVEVLVDPWGVEEPVDVEEAELHHEDAEDERAQRPQDAGEGSSRPEGRKGRDRERQRQRDEHL